ILSRREDRLQIGETGHPVRAQRDQLAVEDCGLDFCLCDHPRHRLQPVGPVVTVTGYQPRTPILHMSQQAIAIEFDLADPALARWRHFRQLAQLRPVIRWHSSANCPWCWRSVRFPRRCFRWADRRLLKDRRAGTNLGFVVMAFDQEPRLLFPALTQPRQRKPPVQPLAFEDEFENALAHAFVSIAKRLPGPPIPGFYRTAAILTGGDLTLEFGIVDWVILDVNGHPFVGWIEGWALGH